MSFQTDFRAFARLANASEQLTVQDPGTRLYATQPFVLSDTPEIRPDNYPHPYSNFVQLPHARPWLMTAHGMLGPQVNTAGSQNNWEQFSDPDMGQHGLHSRPTDRQLFAARMVAPTGHTAVPSRYGSNLIYAPSHPVPVALPDEETGLPVPTVPRPW